FTQGDKITLVRNPNYHWALDRYLDVRFDRIEMYFFDDAFAMATALEMGELDVAQLPPPEYRTLKNKVLDGTLENVETFDGPKCTQYMTEVMVCMSTGGSNPSRLDPVIRQAMAMATNKTYIVNNHYLGLADEGTTLIPPINEKWHYDPSEEETYHYDIDAANALLESAGYRYVNGTEVRVATADSYAVQQGLVPENTPLVYDMAVRQEHPEERDIAEFLKGEWSEVGIEIEYDIMTEAALGALVYSYEYDTAIWCWLSDPDPSYILFCQAEASFGGWNDNMYSSDAYEDNYTASVRTLDYSDRKTYVDNCQRVHYRDASYIILACPYQTYAWRTDTVDGWGDWAENPGRSIDAFWGGNPFYFEPIEEDAYAPVTTAELAGTHGENGWYTSNVTVTLDGQVVFIDTKPPVTTAVVSGTSGDHGWYISEVTVAFEVEDVSGEVDSTWYSLDSAPWEEYVEDIAVGSDGVHILEYYSVDGSDNVENEKTLEIKMDRSDPSIVISHEDGSEFDTSNVAIEFTCDDSLSGVDRCEYSLDGGGYEPCSETGAYLFAVENGEYTIVVQVFDEAGNSDSDSLVFIVNAFVPVSNRSVDYVWSDMFSHPLGEWYETRAMTSSEWIVNDEYPYIYVWEGSPAGNIWTYTFMRLNITGRDMTELNMNENPEFLPFFSDTASGGTAVIDWYMNYVTYEEAAEKLLPGALAWYDGWYIAWNGTVLLDESAAKAVLDISSAEFDDFDTWWLYSSNQTAVDWEDWMMYEAGPERLAIWNMYEWDLMFPYFDLQAEKSDADHVVLTFDTISWGMEALMTRWMHEAWMPTEWYMEDMDIHATIGPYMADVDIDAAVAYSLYAYESILDGTPCWAWEAMLQDYVESKPSYPYSDFDPYADLTYLNRAPGSEWYGEEMLYDYTPGAWNLSENETLTFEWPAGEQLFIVHDPEGTGDGLIDNTVNLTANMTVRYAMPMPFDDPDVVKIDLDQRQITFTGPFDMWTWSKDQTAHEWLMDEWDRLDLLPFGIPYIEFTADIEGDPLEMQIDGLTDPLVVDLPTSFTVTVVDDILVMYLASQMSVGLSAALLSVPAPILDSTMYRVDSGDWAEYESPFVLSDEGVHVVEFYSTDSLGSVEETKSITVKIDRTAPEMAFVTANGTEFDNSSVMIAWNCSDGCSGIDRAEYSIDGAAYVVCSAESYVDLVNLSDGAHVLQVRVYDEAGNMAEDDVQFDVKAVAEDDDDTNLLESLGFWQATAVLAVVAALALGTIFALRRKRSSPPGGAEGPPEDGAGPEEPPG
ncbi:MAG: ABC transporter substrate-binding protein, partial [Thermoplasmata archaeon]